MTPVEELTAIIKSVQPWYIEYFPVICAARLGDAWVGLHNSIGSDLYLVRTWGGGGFANSSPFGGMMNLSRASAEYMALIARSGDRT